MRKKEASTVLLLFLILASATGTAATETTAPKKTEVEKPRDFAREKRYDDPNQPAVVRKTPRHPDAGKLEVDFD
ncbi:MAG: hypothetical protein HYW49_07545 [Deltaproteobacteria bacterium]|nr:hypothetical protein [Deltaproteobacteria bacterium]